jgi:hypothetical protein
MAGSIYSMDQTTLVYAAVLTTIILFFGCLIVGCLCQPRYMPPPLQPPPNGQYGIDKDGRWPGLALKGPPASDTII